MNRSGPVRILWLLGWLGVVKAAFAHVEDDPRNPGAAGELWHAWEWDPGTVICLGLSALFYLRGLWQIWVVMKPGHGIRYWEAACFGAGWLALLVALLSPLHPWGRVLFSAHMTQHEILMLVAAPLLVLGRPMIPMLKALPASWARKLAGYGNSVRWQAIWRRLAHPVAAWLIHALVLWIWHLPSWFQLAIANDLVHALQHASFFFSALLFWWAVMHGRQRVVGYGLAVLYMFTTAMHSGLLGALITFSGSVIYPVYSITSDLWGLTALEDQQLGGLIMWVPAGLVYVIAGLALIAGWMRESERRVIQRESEYAVEDVAGTSHEKLQTRGGR